MKLISYWKIQIIKYLEVITEDDGLSSDFESIFVFNNGTEVTSTITWFCRLDRFSIDTLVYTGGITGISQISQLHHLKKLRTSKSG